MGQVPYDDDQKYTIEWPGVMSQARTRDESI